MQIRDIEVKTGLDRATIRFYEKEGLIRPQRKENGYRVYSEEDRGTLMKVKLLRQLGLSLERIKELQTGGPGCCINGAQPPENGVSGCGWNRKMEAI